MISTDRVAIRIGDATAPAQPLGQNSKIQYTSHRSGSVTPPIACASAASAMSESQMPFS